MSATIDVLQRCGGAPPGSGGASAPRGCFGSGPSAARPASVTSVTTSVHARARRSLAVTSLGAAGALAVSSWRPRAGSTIRAVTHQPTPVSRIVDAPMKYQLHVGSTRYPGCTSCAPASVSGAMIASIDDTTRFAENPPAIPANATTAPATGDRPHAAYKPAASGGTTTNPESAPMCDMNPMVST